MNSSMSLVCWGTKFLSSKVHITDQIWLVDTETYFPKIELKMHLISDWIIQELRYLKFQVHIKMVKHTLKWGDVLSKPEMFSCCCEFLVSCICALFLTLSSSRKLKLSKKTYFYLCKLFKQSTTMLKAIRQKFTIILTLSLLRSL